MLHILNGDATANLFKETGLPGQVLVWREILAEGPATQTPDEKAFWRQRQEYITQSYQETTQNYHLKVLTELNRLQQLCRQQDEIILWFEHDLICQVNLVYYCNGLGLGNRYHGK